MALCLTDVYPITTTMEAQAHVIFTVHSLPFAKYSVVEDIMTAYIII